jgi:hypothetical protein
MKTINVVRNAETISLITMNGADAVYVDIPIPKNIGDSVEMETECLSLNAPGADCIRRKLNIAEVGFTGSQDIVSATIATRDLLHRMWSALDARLQQVGQRPMQGISVQEGCISRTRKKKSIKYIRGKRKTN